MKAVLQRVSSASVSVDEQNISTIGKGLLILLGVESDDSETDINYLVDKITGLRIFEDENYKMNLSIEDIGGELLVVSQFTLLADCRKGRRPSFDKAGKPDLAKELYELFIVKCRAKSIPTYGGKFQAEMLVNINNHGPVTILLDSKKNF